MFREFDPSRYEYFVAMDNRLSFGLSCAPAIFNRLSNAIVRMMSLRGFTADDFVLIGRTNAERQNGPATLITLLHSRGFKISWKKVVSTTTLSYDSNLTL